MSGIIRKAPYYAKLVNRFWREADSPADFSRLMRVRLAQSKVGPLTCRSPLIVVVDVKSLGGQVTLRTHTTDISVLAELVVADSYLPLLRAASRSPRTVVDLGANTGLATRWLLTRWPEAQVVAVEPEPGNSAVLRENVAEFGRRAQVVQACVGGYERDAYLFTESGEHGFRLADPKAVGEGEPVRVRTLESILELAGFDGPVDVLKCDIEGAEQELFDDCRSWIGRVSCIAVECHDGFTVPELVCLLRRNGAEFDLVDRALNPAWNNEVGVLRRVA